MSVTKFVRHRKINISPITAIEMYKINNLTHSPIGAIPEL